MRSSQLSAPDVEAPESQREQAAARSRRLYHAGKRLMDVALSSVALVVLSPMFIIIAILIRLDSPGPALFKQGRIGRNGRTFGMLKFRTMRVDADDRAHREAIARVVRGGRVTLASGEQVFKPPDDERITRVGKFLRAGSLDELPQLINILKGQMSLVGPRPALDYELPYYKAWHHQRFAVRPGLTGLWQVRRKEAEDFDDMMRMDVEYVRSFSLWLDVKLILLTIPAIARDREVF